MKKNVSSASLSYNTMRVQVTRNTYKDSKMVADFVAKGATTF